MSDRPYPDGTLPRPATGQWPLVTDKAGTWAVCPVCGLGVEPRALAVNHHAATCTDETETGV